MKQTINESDFINAFKAYDRERQFSRDGLRALFAYLEEYEDSTGETIELDVISLCCDYTECNIKDVESETGVAFSDLGDYTSVITVDDETIIYQSF